jgi:hypothetical protein
MSPEERQLLTSLFDRVRSAAATPRDRDAEALVDQSTREQPYATYYLAQAVIVRQLEAEQSDNHQAEQGGGFLSSIFGSSQPPQPRTPVAPPEPPSAAPSSGPWGAAPRQQIQQNQGFDSTPRAMPQQQPSGPWSQQMSAPSAGGSFLQGALGTAAGVAGGMLLANSLSGIFGGHMSSLGLGAPASGANPLGGGPVEETVVNNYFGDDKEKPQAASADTKNDDAKDDADLQEASYDDDDDNDDQSDSGGDDSFDV